jgi:hypothetical protein
MRRMLILLATVLTVFAIAAAPAAAFPERLEPEAVKVVVTYYYWTGNRTASGEWPYPGSAACSTRWAFGTRFVFADGRVVRCNDRGLLGPAWVDIFVDSEMEGRDIARVYGSSTTALVIVP